MNREQMAYRCPNATILRVVRLEGYELEFAGMAGNGVATIRPKEGSYVDGVLWKITPKCERGLDFYEGYPHFYGKEMLTVKDRLGENHQAMAYVMNEPYCRSPATPAKSYLQGILDGCDEHGLDKVEAMKSTYRKLGLDCLVILGGNGTQKTANLLREEGLNIIHLPKTIDNDIYGTDVTFGFQSAINIATETIDCIHTTAASHNRVFIVEVMGHKVGWLTLYAGVAGGADIILLPEIPYDIDKVVEAIHKRTKDGKGFTILAVAEGAISKEDAELSKKQYKAKVASRKYPSVSYEIADQIQEKCGVEVRVAVPGHTQRGGSPCPYDRVLCTRLGSAAAKAIMDGKFGYMIAMINNKTKCVPLGEVAGKLKTVDPDSQMIQEAKRIGISFGD